MAFRLYPKKAELGRAALRTLLALAVVLSAGLLWCVQYTYMPGTSHSGAIGAGDKTRQERLETEVKALASIGSRELVFDPEALQGARQHLAGRLEALGFQVQEEVFKVGRDEVANLVVTLPGRGELADEVVLVGAHYDSAHHCPGANDNGSGVAALLEIAREFSGRHKSNKGPQRTLRLVWFANEEPPYFRTAQMGSAVHARRAVKRGDKIVAMYSLETMGYFVDTPGSQNYPAPFSLLYPDSGNFLAFVGNEASSDLVRRTVSTFREAEVPLASEGIAAPSWVRAASFSDHLNFHAHGIPAMMVTDTAMFRYAHYHTAEDTPDKLSYPAFTAAVEGMFVVIDSELRTPQNTSG